MVDCDFIIHNSILWDGSETDTEKSLKKLFDKYSSSTKLIIVFVVSDYQGQYTFYDNLIIVRTSLKASLKRNNELVMPYLWECAYTPFPPVIHPDKPHIGFCGLGSNHRKNVLKVFSQSALVNENFIVRDKFWGGDPHNTELVNTFRDNIRDNAFIVSQRGNGNFSMRFYQTLAAGRIPVLTNTDMVLPFEDKINWRDHIIFEKNEKACLKRVVSVYESGQYIRMQEECGGIFNDYFAEYSFLEQLINQIYRQLESNKNNKHNFINTIQKALRLRVT